MNDFFGNELKIGDKIVVPNFYSGHDDYYPNDGFKPLLEEDKVVDLLSGNNIETNIWRKIGSSKVIKIKE